LDIDHVQASDAESDFLFRGVSAAGTEPVLRDVHQSSKAAPGTIPNLLRTRINSRSFIA
jgi:hypothetical protein